MSVTKNDLFFGTGELFFKRDTDVSGKYVHVGTLKDEVSFSYEMETAEQKPGNRLTVARRDKVSEKAMLKCKVMDFKIGQLIPALGLTISITQITATSTMRAYEDILFGSTTTTKTLGNTAVSMTSVVAYSADRSTKGVRGTDFTVLSTTKIRPLATTVLRSKQGFVAYDTRDVSATVARVGDKINLQTVALKFTHRQSNGKLFCIEIPKATVMNGITLPFNETSYTVYDLTFAALGDMTAPSGRSLFKMIREA